MARNRLLDLQALGQSVWLDYLQRDLLLGGEVVRMIANDGLSGITSNPAIFEKAISGHHDYDAAIAELAGRSASANEMYESLTQEDVRTAADLLHSVYEHSEARDGFVSLEVSPQLAHDTDGTIAEARRLWAALDRPNVMIKVPATPQGLSAIARLIAEGVNVNVTLLFSVSRYRAVVEAYLTGLEERASSRQSLDHVASVASFFLSRIDTLVDARLDQHPEGVSAAALRGQAASANARLAYQHYKEIVASQRWQALAGRGARSQRLLWASTSTKDPRYRDVKYVEALIGPETVNTMPLETLAAYRDHGEPALRLEADLEEARRLPAALRTLGIDLETIAEQLEVEGVRKFVEPFDKLLRVLERRRRDRMPSGGHPKPPG